MQKTEAAGTLNSLIIKATRFLESLSGVMDMSFDNYIGPSGIDLAEFIEIKGLLANNDEGADENDRKTRIIELVDRCQMTRHKHDMKLVSQTSSAIHQLSIAFGIKIVALIFSQAELEVQFAVVVTHQSTTK